MKDEIKQAIRNIWFDEPKEPGACMDCHYLVRSIEEEYLSSYECRADDALLCPIVQETLWHLCSAITDGRKLFQ